MTYKDIKHNEEVNELLKKGNQDEVNEQIGDIVKETIGKLRNTMIGAEPYRGMPTTAETGVDSILNESNPSEAAPDNGTANISTEERTSSGGPPDRARISEAHSCVHRERLMGADRREEHGEDV